MINPYAEAEDFLVSVISEDPRKGFDLIHFDLDFRRSVFPTTISFFVSPEHDMRLSFFHDEEMWAISVRDRAQPGLFKTPEAAVTATKLDYQEIKSLWKNYGPRPLSSKLVENAVRRQMLVNG